MYVSVEISLGYLGWGSVKAVIRNQQKEGF